MRLERCGSGISRTVRQIRSAQEIVEWAVNEIRRIGYHWNLRQVMAQRNLWKTTELIPLLQARGVKLSTAQVHRLVTTSPERIPARTFAALCDILNCTPNDLFVPYLEGAELD